MTSEYIEERNGGYYISGTRIYSIQSCTPSTVAIRPSPFNRVFLG
jgi:hypothetical protein